ncbi:hypothetical protein WAA24_004328 [Stenotrophomonas maltophilia]
MALGTCAECGHAVSSTAVACPGCGAVTGNAAIVAPPVKSGGGIGRVLLFLFLGGLGILVFMIVLGSIIGSTPEGKERQRERDAIELCWKDYERKSFDPGTKLFIATACEKMEADFRAKHGRNP